VSTVTPRLGLTKPAGAEQYSVTVLNNNNDIIDGYVSGTADKMAQGIKLKAEVTTPSGAFTDVIVNNFGSFTFKAGRKYKLVWDYSWNASAGSTYINASINTCLTTDAANLLTGLTILNSRTAMVQGAGLTEQANVTAFYEPVADSTVQIKFRGTRAAGSGNITVVGSSTEKAIYYIEDMGAQY